jgi:hypothetical protein
MRGLRNEVSVVGSPGTCQRFCQQVEYLFENFRITE